MALHVFLTDCDDLENWLETQIKVAENPDCGCDTETLNNARSDFKNFENRTKDIGSRRMKRIEEDAEPLRKRGSALVDDVNKRIAILKGLWRELLDALARKGSLLQKMSDIFTFDELVTVCIDRIKVFYQVFSQSEENLRNLLLN